MQHPAATIPIFDKSHLFLPLTANPFDPNMNYLQCPATGHIYCLTTGSLYQVTTTIPMSTNIPALLQRKERYSPLLPSNAAPCTEQVSFIHPINNPDQTIRCNTSSPTPCDQGIYLPSIKTKCDQPPQSNPPAQSKIKSSANPQSNLTKTTKTKNKHMKIIQDKPVPIQAKPMSAKQKSASASQLNPNIDNLQYPATGHCLTGILFQETTIPRFTNVLSRKKQPPQNNTPAQSKIKSSENPQSNPAPTTKKKNKHMKIIQDKPVPTQPKPVSPKKKPVSAKQSISIMPSQVKSSKSFKTKSAPNKNTTLPPMTQIQAVSLSKRNSTATSQSKPSTRSKYKQVSRRVNKISIWRFLVPFNRRPRPKKSPQHDEKEPNWSHQCKNRIMASSVHEIIHSRFTKNEKELMPVSQLQALLSSGYRKPKTIQERIRHMEEEAIHKFKKLNLEKHKLKVEDKSLLSHPIRPWLVSIARKVIDKSGKDSWPLLVKCLYKHPDSTLQEASKHRSFCLSRWSKTSYSLRRDHAYYTQIQCHMAVSETRYAELLVHTNKETTIVPVYFDNDFWVQAEAKLDEFFIDNVLPYWRKNKIQPYENRDSSESLESESNVIFQD